MLSILAITLIIWSTQPRHPKLLDIPYNHTAKTISIYDAHGQPLILHLSFQTKQLALQESMKNQNIFLDKHKKYPIEHRMVQYHYKIKPGFKKHEEGVVGIMGIGQGSAFQKIVKHAFNSSGVKFIFRRNEPYLKAVGQHCKYPVFPPFMITLSQTNTHSYQIDHLSTAFAPDSSFLSVINQSKSPFSLDKHQLSTDITVSLRDQIISLPLSHFVHCGKYSTSSVTLQCEVQLNQQADVGGLLFDFDPVICESGVQIDVSNLGDGQYHYSHLILLIVQLGLLIWLCRQDKVAKIVKDTIDGKVN